MTSVFWDYKGLLLIDYLQKGKNINSEHYCSLLDRLYVKIGEKSAALKKKKYI